MRIKVHTPSKMANKIASTATITRFLYFKVAHGLRAGFRPAHALGFVPLH
jgi:hypothetical protein